jgi:hypothetical protein
MFGVMAIHTQGFKVGWVKRYFGVINIYRSKIYFMVRHLGGSAAPFTDIIL